MLQDVTEDSSELSERQLRAVPYLSAAMIFTEAAENLGVSRETMSLWFNDPTVRDVYERQWDEAAEISIDEIRVLMLKSFIALAERLVSDGPRRPVRVLPRRDSPSDPLMTDAEDAEIEREAHKRLIQLISDAKNDCNRSGHAKHRTVSRPRNHTSETPSYPHLRALFPKPRLDM